MYQQTSDFLDNDGAFKALYTNLSGLVKHNHIFTCNGDDYELIMKFLRESNLDEQEIIRHTAVRPSRGIRNDFEMLRTRSAVLLQPIKPPGINAYKQVCGIWEYPISYQH